MPNGQIPFTPRAKKVLESALEEALALGHSYIGTEHLLLGLLRLPASAGAEVVADFAELDHVRNEVIAMLSGTHQRLLGQVDEYRPKSPPLAIEVLDEIERRRRALEQALDAGDTERASFAQEQLDDLVRATRRLERAWFGETPVVASARVGGFAAIPDEARMSVVSLAPQRERLLLVGGLLFGSAATIGIVAGWLIWG